MNERTIELIDNVNKFKDELINITSLPLEVQPSKIDYILHRKLFENTRGYILQIVDQINLSYENTCYDACAVMIRRIIEILIIEVYDKFDVEDEICNADGNYYYLNELISRAISSSHWKLGRNTKTSMKKLKTIGDMSAHSRRYNAKRSYIDDLVQDIRVVIEELLYLSGLRK